MIRQVPADLSMKIIDNEEGGFDELFVSTSPEEYNCPICLLVTNHPMQTSCGHRFCKSCILKVIRGGQTKCPIDNQYLDEKRIYPDSVAWKEILRLNVRCRNMLEHGCKWIGNLKLLEKHLNECEYTTVICPNNCGKVLFRFDFNEHLLTCKKRIVACQYCDTKVVFKILKDHHDICYKLPIKCPNACGEVPRDELQDHLQNHCPNSIVKCVFRGLGCVFEGNREAMKIHKENSKDQHLENMIGVIRTMNIAYAEHGNDLQYRQYQLEITRLSNRVSELEVLIDNIKENSIITLEQKIEHVTQQTKQNEHVIQEINARTWNGCVIWKINKFKELFLQAQDGTTPAIYSLPFYTAIPGYKMCIRINLNGVDCGAGTHISMFVHLMQGEYDSIIQWPFNGMVSFTIIDQDAPGVANHVVEELSANPSLHSFQRPETTKNNNGYGYASMMSHDMVQNGGYIKHDTMYVKVEVKMKVKVAS